MKTNNIINWRALLKVSGIAAMAALTMNVSADTYTFPSASSGSANWDSNSAGGWVLEGTGTIGTLPPGGADVDVVIGSGTNALVFEYVIGGTGVGTTNVVRNSLTISDSVTLQILYHGHRIAYSTVTNQSLMEVLGTRTIAKDTGGGSPLLFINSGTILHHTTGAQLTINGTINNTGGLIDLGGGARFSLAYNNNNAGIYGGTLTLASSGTFDTGSVLTGTVTFSDVAINNAGVMVAVNNVTNNDYRRLYFTATNGIFNNTGTVSVWQGVNHDISSINNSVHTDVFTQSGTNVFTNTGVISVLNESVTNSSAYYETGVAFNVSNNAAAGGKFTNDGLIDIRDNAHGTYSSTTYARFTVNNGADFTNSGTINIALGNDVTDDALHTAALFINTDWANTGVITVDRANKEHATASLELNGQTYTQTGADSETRLLNDGQLKASAVIINDGLLGGAGLIDAATTLNTGATLDPDGTLTLASLTMNNGSILNFSATDLLQINGDLNFNGATLTLTDYTGGDPLLLANYTGDLLGKNLTISGLDNAVLNFDTIGKIYLVVIPEPTTTFLLTLGALILILMRKPRRKNTER
ncbi:MAG: PEP-CTERM sorting domain-containing protein [Verrucomicrobiales bacterium]|jgi:hypothetical protein|nr:PEP-CTERM sorting domain-containing protein [Verrucomicrobiales bacterium]